MRTSVLIVSLVFVGCYGRPELPEPPPIPADSSSVDASRARPTPEPRPAPQAVRAEQLDPVLERLGGAAGHAAPQRPGAATWRPAELEKLHELLLGCCLADAGPCRACSTQIGAAGLPPDELWSLAGRFLGPLRPRAKDGLLPLLRPHLDSEDPEARDRAHRLLVGSGLIRRTPPGPEGYAASALPQHPRPGEAVWIFAERITPCPRGAVGWKGPDGRGRLDVTLEPDCPPADEPDVKPLAPAVHRLVASMRLESVPPAGVTLYSPDVVKPLLSLEPGAPDPKPEATP